MVAEDGAAQGQDTLHRRGSGAEVPPAGVDHLQPPGQVAHRQEGGQDLPQHGGQGDALHPHIQPEEEDGVKDHVENGPGEQDRTGVPGAAVSPDHMGHGRGKDAEGHPQEEDEGIGPGVGHHGLGGPEEVEHGLQKHQAKDGHQQAHRHRQDHGVAQVFPGAGLVSPAQEEAVPRGAADADEAGQGRNESKHGKGHVGCGDGQIADPPAHEGLVYNVVHGADHLAANGRQGEGPDEFVHRRGVQGRRAWVGSHRASLSFLAELVRSYYSKFSTNILILSSPVRLLHLFPHQVQKRRVSPSGWRA